MCITWKLGNNFETKRRTLFYKFYHSGIVLSYASFRGLHKGGFWKLKKTFELKLLLKMDFRWKKIDVLNKILNTLNETEVYIMAVRYTSVW